MKIRWPIIAIVIIVLLYFLVENVVEIRVERRSPAAATYAEIVTVYRTLWQFQEKGGNIATIIDLNPPNNKTVNQRMTVLLRNRGVLRKLKRSNTDPQEVVDAWGTPLIFVSTNSMFVKRVNAQLRSPSLPVIVYSAGANETNDWGEGDDVSYWPDF